MPNICSGKLVESFLAKYWYDVQPHGAFEVRHGAIEHVAAAIPEAAAAVRGRKILVTSSLESAVGRRGAAHLAAAVLALGPQPAAGIATGALVEEDLGPDPFAPAGGTVRIPALPGLGLP